MPAQQKQTPKPKRPPQLKCVGCSHVASFHSGGKTGCKVVGCKCTRWQKPRAEVA